MFVKSPLKADRSLYRSLRVAISSTLRSIERRTSLSASTTRYSRRYNLIVRNRLSSAQHFTWIFYATYSTQLLQPLLFSVGSYVVLSTCYFKGCSILMFLPIYVLPSLQLSYLLHLYLLPLLCFRSPTDNFGGAFASDVKVDIV